MAPPATALYEHGLRQIGQDSSASHDWAVQLDDGRRYPLGLARWCGDLSVADASLVELCDDPTVDVGCGPGRLAAAITRRGGGHCLGVDTSREAVRTARLAGATAIVRSIFGTIPGEGQWSVALLADGNIGIGADPVRLLHRMVDLLADDGRIIVELDRPGVASGTLRLRLVTPSGVASEWFKWGRVSVDDIDVVAARSALQTYDVWREERRWFAMLCRR